MQQNVYVCFVDFEKAFDRVRHNKLVQILLNVGVDKNDIRIIQNLYWSQEAAVRIGNNLSNWCKVRKGVRQGCVLSPLLYNLYSEMLMREVIRDEDGICINGKHISNIRYADDTAFIARSPEELQGLLNRLQSRGAMFGLRINIGKTKVMAISRDKTKPVIRITVAGQNLEQVNQFTYLGSVISDDGKCEVEIRRRISQAKLAFLRLGDLLRRDINLRLKTRFLRCFVWSRLLYGTEAWTLSADTQRKLDAFEMWCYRKMLRISYIDRVSNVEVLRRMSTHRQLLDIHRRRKLAYFGHVVRGEGKLVEIVMGKIAGRRVKGRQRLGWLDDVKRWVGGLTLREVVDAARDRTRWRIMAANPQN